MRELKGLIGIDQWFGKKLHLPMVIAGPCAAESRPQLLSTAEALVQSNEVGVFRAGIWKPRTRPNCFEGVGEEGLEWLAEVKQLHQIPVATEVATPAHVELALKYGVDMVWIGARTTVNPFSVSDIAQALKGTDVVVLVKNPVNPDLDLWLGAIERIYDAGIRKLGAIHRGFNTYGKKVYKNAPLWEIPIELKRKFPDLPIFIDPSHLGGRRELLFEIAQKALDINMDGLMVETHIAPEKALSDSLQQVSPTALFNLLEKLVVRNPDTDNIGFEQGLEYFRNIIDDLDDQMLNVLSKRMQICEKIGEYKYTNNLTVLQLKRWNKIFESRVEKGKQLGLDEVFLRKVLELVHKESIQVQTEMMQKLSGRDEE